jgi:hypothetical protein
MALVASLVALAILLATVGCIALIVRVAMRRGAYESAAAPRVPRSLLVVGLIALGILGALVLTLKLAGGL